MTIVLPICFRPGNRRDHSCSAGRKGARVPGTPYVTAWANRTYKDVIAPYGHPAGTPGAGGLGRLWARENDQRLSGGEWGETDWNSRDTIPNCSGEFREIKERTSIAACGHPAGTPEQSGVERLGHERTVNG